VKVEKRKKNRIREKKREEYFNGLFNQGQDLMDDWVFH
jgi:hypothetical protein